MQVTFGPALFSLDLHARLTYAANGGLLTQDQLGFVVLANLAQDRLRGGPHHFDPGTFTETAAYIHLEWSLIDSLDDRFSQPALDAFGRLLHPVQDFYMHSNWVEVHRHSSRIPIWDMTGSSLPPGIEGGYRLTRAKGLEAVDAGPHSGRLLYELAYDAALLATRRQFARLAGGSLYRCSWLAAGPVAAEIDRIS